MAYNWRRGLADNNYTSSEDDEDYVPPGMYAETPPSSRGPTRRERDEAEIERDDSLAHRQRTLLRQQQQQQQPNLNQTTAKTQPSYSNLPREVLHNILLQACSTAGAIPVAYIFASVCTSWRDAVQTCPPQLYSTLDLSYGWCKPQNSTLAAQCSKWTALTNLNLSGCKTISEVGLAAVAAACPLIQTLDISHCSGFREPGLSDVLLTMLLRSNDSTAPSAPLTALNLSAIEVAPKGTGIDTVLRRIFLEPNGNNPLESLICEGCPHMSDKAFKAVTSATVAAKRPFLSALKVLSISGSGAGMGHFTINIPRLQLTTPRLESINLCDVALPMGWEPSLSTSGLLINDDDGGGGDGADGGLSANDAHWPLLLQCYSNTQWYSTFPAGWLTSKSALLSQLISRSPLIQELSFMGYGELELDAFVDAFPFSRAHAQHGDDDCCCITRLQLDGTYLHCMHSYEHAHHTFTYFTFLDFLKRCPPSLKLTLEELSVVRTREVFFDDAACAALAEYERLRYVDAQETVITEKGVKQLLEKVKERGALDGFVINIAGCRGVERRVRQAASQGMKELIRVLEV